MAEPVPDIPKNADPRKIQNAHAAYKSRASIFEPKWKPITKVKRLRLLLPVVAFVFGSCSIYYSISQNAAGRTVCVNCDRQKQIAEEVYGGKRKVVQKGYNL